MLLCTVHYFRKITKTFADNYKYVYTDLPVNLDSQYKHNHWVS